MREGESSKGQEMWRANVNQSKLNKPHLFLSAYFWSMINELGGLVIKYGKKFFYIQ